MWKPSSTNGALIKLAPEVASLTLCQCFLQYNLAALVKQSSLIPLKKEPQKKSSKKCIRWEDRSLFTEETFAPSYTSAFFFSHPLHLLNPTFKSYLQSSPQPNKSSQKENLIDTDEKKLISCKLQNSSKAREDIIMMIFQILQTFKGRSSVVKNGVKVAKKRKGFRKQDWGISVVGDGAWVSINGGRVWGLRRELVSVSYSFKERVRIPDSGYKPYPLHLIQNQPNPTKSAENQSILS